MEFRVLGPLEVVEEDRTLEVGGAKHRTLLAALLLNANRVVSKERLIEALWPGDAPDTAPKVLHVYVSQLRKVLGKDRLRTKAPGYLLRVHGGELDLERFQLLAEAERPGEALALWRGPPLAEFAHEGFAEGEIARLEELRLVCLERRIQQELDDGRHAELVGELEALVREEPLRERLRGQLMLALYRSGRQAEALDTYTDLRRALVEELGIDPGRAMRELQQAVLRQDQGLDLHSTPTKGVEQSVGARGSFVGRERELERLHLGLGEVLAGRGRLFLLTGEPGIGKSRLAEELVGRARARGARVLHGRCWEAGGAPVYWPWVQPLRAYVGETAPAALRAQLGSHASDLTQLLPELRELFPDLPRPPALDSDGARFRLFEAMSACLRRAAEDQPLVLVLDDLHAADEASLLLLLFLARQLDTSRLLVVAAYRDVDPSPTEALKRIVTELAREPGTESLALTGLGERDVARFIELTSRETPSAGLVFAIHEKTAGNPLFVGEIVRLLAEEWHRADTDAPRLAIPQSVRDVIARRLRHLSEESNRLLVLASVLGREFSLAALARASGVQEDELLEALDEAMAARAIADVPASAGHLRFVHVLIRDTLYEGLTTPRRVRLHMRALAALEALYTADPGPHLAELAHHALAGNDVDKALHYARRAGDRALALAAYEEAARLYRAALQVLDDSDDPNDDFRCELLLALGEAQARGGASPEAQSTFLQAAEIARRASTPEHLGLAALGYGGRFVWGRGGHDAHLVPLLEEALNALDPNDSPLRVKLLARLAGGLRDQSARDLREARSGEAVEMARRIADPTTLGHALDGSLAAVFWPEDPRRRFTVATELLRAAAESGDREMGFQAHDYRATALLQLGDASGVDAELYEMARLADELRQPAQLWAVLHAQATRALYDGRFAEAEQLIQQAFDVAQEALGPDAVFTFHVQTFVLHKELGRLAEIEQTFMRFADDYPRPLSRCLLANLLSAIGHHDHAQHIAEEYATSVFALPRNDEWLLSSVMLAEVCTKGRDVSRSAILYELLLPCADSIASFWNEASAGSVSRYLGTLAATMGRFQDAAQHFEDALRANELAGARPWLAHTYSDYARMLLIRDASGDREPAQDLLNRARAIRREIGVDAYESSHAQSV
jgi:DNA-binding SARP family transcriptional activator